jgi:hypothetical protein
MAITLLILQAFVIGLARFNERIVVRITKPASMPLPTFHPGIPYPVEGIANSGASVYMPVGWVILELIGRDERVPGGRVSHGSWAAKYDPASKQFSGTITVSKSEKSKKLYVSARAIDGAGRHHPVPDDEEIPVTIE